MSPIRLPCVAVTLVINEPSNAGYLPAAVVCTSWVLPLKVLPAVVTDVGSMPAGKVFVPVIFAAVMLVKLAPLIAGRLAIVVALPTLVTLPVKLALVVTVAALPPIFKAVAVPVMFVPTNALGVPNAGVTKVGDVFKTTLPVPVVPKFAEPRAEAI